MRGSIALFASMLLLVLSAIAQPRPEAAWVSLFNIIRLAGWKKNGEEKWIVEERTILCENSANKYS